MKGGRKLFTPLNVRSAYSLLQSPMTVEHYVKDAKHKGYKTLILSEWETLSSAIKFFNLCLQERVKPVIALSFEWKGEYMQAIALNTSGYFELVDLSSRLLSQQAIDLVSYQQIAIIIRAPFKDTFESTYELLDKTRVYVAVHCDDNALMTWADEKQLPLLADHTVRYANPSDFQALTILEAIQQNTSIADVTMHQTGPDYLPLAKQFEEQFRARQLDNIIEQTKAFYENIQIDIPVKQKLLPKFTQNADERLAEVARLGLEKRGLVHDKMYQERLSKELEIISQMAFSDYFLIVWDLMQFAHQNAIVTGAGRGSSAASLVSFCLNITQVDPIKHDLLFERFLNPERYTMPDIDLDFPDNRRQDVLNYVVKKYGQEKVAQIATFGTLAAKQALRDVARVLGYSQVELKQLTNLVPSTLKITLDVAYNQSKKLQQWVEKNEKNALVFNIARQIEGLPRHISTHAAGVVISDYPLMSLTPVQQVDAGIQLTQMTMEDVEYTGLLKMDFLGLKNLSILADAQEAVKQSRPEFDIWQIDWQDKETLQLFAQADTEGVFQFESAGIRRVLEQMKPQTLEDVAAVNALYRPGPMEQIPHFIARKHEREKVSYPHPDLRNILEETYGIIVYQEQVMQIASQMAGFSLGQADLLRRAMGKRKHDVMEAEREHFITGALEKGYSQTDAVKVFQYIEKFASYGFVKSHAFAYSMLAYQLAYIKVHFPNAFYLALLRHTSIKSERFSIYLMEAKQHQVAFVLPSINQSYEEHTVLSNQRIQIGLSAIQGIRRDMRQFILQERYANGKFSSLTNFIDRMPEKYAKQEILEQLIYAGAFDEFQQTRATLLANIEQIKQTKNLLSGMGLSPKFIELSELEEAILIEKEKAVLGFTLTSHLEKYQYLYGQGGLKTSIDSEIGQKIYLLGRLKRLKTITTKSGKRMAFATLEDQFGQIALTLFPDVYTRVLTQLIENTDVVIYGKVDYDRYDEKVCVVETVLSIGEYEKKWKAQQYICYIRLASNENLKVVLTILSHYRGDTPVVVYDALTHTYKKLSEKYNIDFHEKLKKELEGKIGEGSVVYQKKKKE